MSPRAGFLLGAITAVLFVGAGLSLLADGNRVWGAGLVLLGLLRGLLLYQQRPRDDDDDD